MMDVRQRSERGFTLIELIISFTILALLAGIVFASLRMAVDAYDRSQIRIDQEATKRALFDQIKRQIGSLFPVRPRGAFVMASDPSQQLADPITQMQAGQTPLFDGEPDFVTFVTVAPLVMIQNPGLTVVRYGLAQNEYGDYYLGSMESRYTGQESFDLMITAPHGKPLPLVEKLRTLSFRYYGFDPASASYGWFPAWRSDEMGGIPEAIRIDFDTNYVLVPVNTSAAAGTLAGQIRQAHGLFGQ
jgi:prepilin-type N-terminal cleavage/methylation domain-containing protein